MRTPPLAMDFPIIRPAPSCNAIAISLINEITHGADPDLAVDPGDIPSADLAPKNPIPRDAPPTSFRNP